MVIQASRRIKINLRNGIYILGAFGGDGKSYLCNILKDVSVLGDFKVAGISYRDYVEMGEESIVRKLQEDLEVVMLDRFNLYCTDNIIDVVNRMSHKTVFLIDYKYNSTKFPLSIKDYKSAVVLLTEEGIEVR